MPWFRMTAHKQTHTYLLTDLKRLCIPDISCFEYTCPTVCVSGQSGVSGNEYVVGDRLEGLMWGKGQGPTGLWGLRVCLWLDDTSSVSDLETTHTHTHTQENITSPWSFSPPASFELCYQLHLWGAGTGPWEVRFWSIHTCTDTHTHTGHTGHTHTHTHTHTLFPCPLNTAVLF